MDEECRAALNSITWRIIDAAIEVHKTLGPGLLEGVYRSCFVYELRADGLVVVEEKAVSISYKGFVLSGGYRLDFLVEDCIVVELKSVEHLMPVHSAQLLSYLRLTNKPIGLLINFNVPRLYQGIKRVING